MKSRPTCEKSRAATLQSLIEQVMANSPSHGIQLQVDSPQLNLSWTGACGFTDREQNSQRDLLTPAHPLRIASNTKTYVAAAILRLWEMQHLALDAAIEPYLCSVHSTLLKEAGYALERMTIRQLLAHTSGLYDYADSSAFSDAISANPQKHWTRTEQIKLAIKAGKPYGEPGEVFRYSDTGYILLGEIIEQVSGQPLGTALRTLLNYECLGLNATWLEIAEPEPSGLPSRIHQYEGDFDTFGVHGSFDIYGGGGLVATIGDMARFLRGLFQNQVFSDPNTLRTMLTPVPAKRGGPAYGGWQQVPGTYRLGIDGGKTGTVFSHRGHFGTLAAYIPSVDMVVACSLGNSRNGAPEDPRDAFLNNILTLFDVAV